VGVEVLVDEEVSLITSSSRIGSFLPKLFRGEGMEPGEAGEAGINAELGLPRAIARLKCKPMRPAAGLSPKAAALSIVV